MVVMCLLLGQREFQSTGEWKSWVVSWTYERLVGLSQSPTLFTGFLEAIGKTRVIVNWYRQYSYCSTVFTLAVWHKL